MAKSGNAAGSGLAEMVPSPPRKLQERPGSQITSSSALTDSKSAGTKREPEFNIRVRETVDVVSRKLTCVEAMLDPAVPMYCNPENTEPAVVEMLTDNSDNAVVSTLKMPVTLPPSPRTGTETSHVIVAALTGPTCVSVSDAPHGGHRQKISQIILAPENARHGVNTRIFRLVRQWPLDQAFSHAVCHCPLWVKSGHVRCNSACPLCRRKRTFAGADGRHSTGWPSAGWCRASKVWQFCSITFCVVRRYFSLQLSEMPTSPGTPPVQSTI